MIPLLLAVAAVALYVLPLVMPKPQEPDDIALPPLGPATPLPSAPDFVSAVKAVDAVVAYLIDSDQYGAAQQQAARVLRAAVVEGATPPVPPGLLVASEAAR